LRLNPTVGRIHGAQITERVICESNTMVRYGGAVNCVRILSVQPSAGAVRPLKIYGTHIQERTDAE